MPKTPKAPTIFFPLPANACRPIKGGCQCKHCEARPGAIPQWDTLAVDSANPQHTWTVHMPELRWTPAR